MPPHLSQGLAVPFVDCLQDICIETFFYPKTGDALDFINTSFFHQKCLVNKRFFNHRFSKTDRRTCQGSSKFVCRERTQKFFHVGY